MAIKKGSLIENLRIEKFAFGGSGIGYLAEKDGNIVVLVDQTLPGQIVTAKVTKSKSRYIEGRLIKIEQHGPLEIESPYQLVAGSPFATLPIEEQHKLKTQVTKDVYERIGRLTNIDELIEGLVASPLTYHYRNKMEYSFGAIVHNPETSEGDDGFALGSKSRGTWWKVDRLLKASPLFDEGFESRLNEMEKVCKAQNLPAWHAPQKIGFFRFLSVKKSFAEDKFLITLITSSQGIENFDVQPVFETLKDILGNRLAGFFHAINDSIGDHGKIERSNNRHIFGTDHITERICGLQFKIGMESFFQPNPLAAERLYEKVSEYVFRDKMYSSDQVIMDLFCGTGTIGQVLASRTAGCRIIGVDIVEEAIEHAQANASLNNISGAEFVAADVGKFLTQRPELIGKIETIVLDPPRAGVVKDTLEKVIALGASRIVYVSCNPSTQARDFLILKEAGYSVKAISLVDQFPHTGHIEAVALLERE